MSLLFIVCYKGKPMCPPLSKLAATEKMMKLSRFFSNLEIVEVKQQLVAT
ncbi:hypothetical protein M5X11_10735 [Paenibacillus alginolyticus]|uniref:Uncharacterized protein n=1 Tax=Paenibacillus alginolyticus TaxID=59839 RepID=A0ABT4GNH5_9BACL|nr:MULTISPECIES: hypothetical protein [Paenibacillus]MCY9665433.1 hypothetical protein [Paenibacillus alginolyticus]MCY9697769.1 hypothetical protein [Paenibacillus alginolyticus]MEC0147316.1 hypothetical protein [Paenibacillus alginolyticus]NRF95638.1 hypothetical protein [Paenibacillus frigoriresistens]